MAEITSLFNNSSGSEEKRIASSVSIDQGLNGSNPNDQYKNMFDIYWNEYAPDIGFCTFPEEDGWMLIHPTTQSMLFRKILAGDFGYTDGQGIYSAVRSTETVIRQVQATVLMNALDATRYEDLAADWDHHIQQCNLHAGALAERYGLCGESEAVRLAHQVFETWRQTLQSSLLEFLRGITGCLYTSGLNGRVGFAKYVDWIACVGIVPVVRKVRSEQNGTPAPLNTYMGQAAELSQMLKVADATLARGAAVVTSLVECMQNVAIMDYDRTRLYYNYNRRLIMAKDDVTGMKGECLVVWPPVVCGEGVVFDSPLQRLSGEVLACYALREHARVCQVLNTAPLRVLIGRRNEDDRSHSTRAVDRIMGENDTTRAGSAASRLVKLIVNLKNMRHVGDITETVRSYLEETGNHILEGSGSVDTSQPGFGKANQSFNGGAMSGTTNVQSAFKTSVVNSINGMLEGYVNNLFKTIEGLKDVNSDLTERLQFKEGELKRLREERVKIKPSKGSHITMAEETRIADLNHEVIDLTGIIGDDAYIANSFQSRYIPPYGDDIKRLSELWKQELVRCFKLHRVNNNQGQEISVSYSNASISLLVAPYFSFILRATRLGFLVTQSEVHRSEEELCQAIFKKARTESYLSQIRILYEMQVRAEVIKRGPRRTPSPSWGLPDPTEDDERIPEPNKINNQYMHVGYKNLSHFMKGHPPERLRVHKVNAADSTLLDKIRANRRRGDGRWDVRNKYTQHFRLQRNDRQLTNTSRRGVGRERRDRRS
uniref:ORF54 n=1 Tax=Human herpesvirus 3 TaxID=10335 RepID=A0A4D6F8L9_HHV3|nr:ORF54 [Human alphaherpesvirus 3]